MKIVRKEENHVLGGTDNGCGAFFMKKGFNMFILFSGPIEDVPELVKTIPYFDTFMKVRVIK